MISGQSHHFFLSLLVICHFAHVSSHRDSRAYSYAVSLSPCEKPMWNFIRMNNWKKEVVIFHQQRLKYSKETKNDNTGSKIWIKHKWNQRRNNCSWKCSAAAVPVILDVQSDTVSESQFTDIKKGSGCHGKGKDVLQDMIQRKNFMLKEHSQIFRDIESTKHEMLEDYSNSEKNIIYQNVEKMLPLYITLYHEKALLKLDKVFTKK